MPTYSATWSQTERALEVMFERWGIPESDWDVERYYHGRRTANLTADQRRVKVWFKLRGRMVELKMDEHPTPAENLRPIYLVLNDRRLAEVRGLAKLTERTYQALAAPPQDDPYEVLGLERGATPNDVNAAYRRLAKSSHPDAGGDAEDFKRLGVARDAILREE